MRYMIYPLLLIAGIGLGLGFTSVTEKLNNIDKIIEIEPIQKNTYTDYAETQKYCMSMAIYFESRGESIKGQQAVALVILNRVDSKSFPNTICEVVKHTKHYEPDGSPTRDRCQFSFWCNGKKETIKDQKLWKVAQQITEDMLSKNVKDFTLGAEHYHAKYRSDGSLLEPFWITYMNKTIEIGNHIFYKRR